MTLWTPPAHPKIYHITHAENLPSIVASGGLECDKKMIERPDAPFTIGMSEIKKRRLSLPVHCHPGDHVGDYVPFYFCPRSLMLYVIHRANHPDLQYRGGQEPIVHLEADLHEVVSWAELSGHRWAFSLSNAGARYAQFRTGVQHLNEVNWPAVTSTDFRSPEGKEGKQAEFLVHGVFPWNLVRRIGVRSMGMKESVVTVLESASHRPSVELKPDWYY